MSRTKQAVQAQPLWTVAGITTAVSATITLLVSFGFEITAEQTNAILGLTSVLAPTVLALVLRRKVVAANRVVVELDQHGQDVAGAASDLPTGTAVDVLQTPAGLGD